MKTRLVLFAFLLGACSGEIGESGLETAYAKSTWIARLYQTVFGRDPSADEVDIWVTAMSESGLSATEVASKFVNSGEHHTRIVVDLYARYLKRAADDGGRAYWAGQLDAGMWVDEAEMHFLTCDEYRVTRSGSDPRSWVANLYRDVLGREASAGEVDVWVSALTKLSSGSVATRFVKSVESRQHLIAGTYQRYLGRAPTAGEIDEWTRHFADGGTRAAVQIALVTSDEFIGGAGGLGDDYVECGDDEFECDDGNGCYTEDAGCDGVADCADGSDESPDYCDGEGGGGDGGDGGGGGGGDGGGGGGGGGAECPEDECDDGTCLSFDAFCDGTPQCPDGSDESPENCDDGGGGDDCPEDVCDDGTCMPYDALCDGTPQCPDESDEAEEYCSDEEIGEDRAGHGGAPSGEGEGGAVTAGGCSAAGASSGGPAGLILLLAAVLLAGRRRDAASLGRRPAPDPAS
jgi:hypothetical protein